jgi:hypothetical protein
MRMTAEERSLAPELHRYLRDDMPSCAHISVIVNNLVKYGGMSVTQARHALQWGTDPYVFAQDPLNRRCRNARGHAKCCFEATVSDTIFINLKDYNRYANGMGMGYTAWGGAVPIVGVAALHALCHWGNYHNGVAETREAGFGFERSTYGKVVG